MSDPTTEKTEVLDYATSRPPPPKEDRWITRYLIGWLIALIAAAAAILVLRWIHNALSRSIGG
jgi:hypothetical protein